MWYELKSGDVVLRRRQTQVGRCSKPADWDEEQQGV